MRSIAIGLTLIRYWIFSIRRHEAYNRILMRTKRENLANLFIFFGVERRTNERWILYFSRIEDTLIGLRQKMFCRKYCTFYGCIISVCEYLMMMMNSNSNNNRQQTKLEWIYCIYIVTSAPWMGLLLFLSLSHVSNCENKLWPTSSFDVAGGFTEQEWVYSTSTRCTQYAHRN